MRDKTSINQDPQTPDTGVTQQHPQPQPDPHSTEPYNTQEQPQAIIVTQPGHGPNVPERQTYKSKLAKALGAIQVTTGGLSVIFAVAGLVNNELLWKHHLPAARITGIPRNITYNVAPGIWCSVIYIVAGSFTIVAATKRSTSAFIRSVIASILAAIFACIQIIFAAVSIHDDRATSKRVNYYGPFRYTTCLHDVETSLALASLLLVLGISEVVIAVWTAVIGYKVTATPVETPTDHRPQCVPVAQPMVIYTPGGVSGHTMLPHHPAVVLSPGSYTGPPAAPESVFASGPPPLYENLQEKC